MKINPLSYHEMNSKPQYGSKRSMCIFYARSLCNVLFHDISSEPLMAERELFVHWLVNGDNKWTQKCTIHVNEET